MPMNPLLCVVLASCCLAPAFARAQAPKAEAPRPQLRILNGAAERAQVFWQKSARERVDNGSIEPGQHRDITTTLGHRFVVVGSQSRREMPVTVEVPVQAARFDPPSPTGVPAFYTQSLSAHGFPITASAKVNPYALKEAAFLVDQMLANRPDVRTAMIQSGARLCILAHDPTTQQADAVGMWVRTNAPVMGVLNSSVDALPGYYMMFIISDEDVPSEAKWVKLQ